MNEALDPSGGRKIKREKRKIGRPIDVVIPI